MVIQRLSSAIREQDWPTLIVEFLLVLLGVLLALQLDNWNQQRKDQALMQDYLHQLQEDLRVDIERAERRIFITGHWDDRADYFRAAITEPSAVEIDHSRLVSAILTAGYVNLDLVNRQTYDELISTGNLRLFTDTELKRLIGRYYASSETSSQWNTLIQSVQIDYRRETRNLLTAEQFRWARRNQREIAADGAPGMDMDRFWSKVNGNDDLLGVLNAMAEIHERIRSDSAERVTYATALLEALEAASDFGE